MSASTPSFLCTPVIEHNGTAHVSSQLPRVKGELVHRGCVEHTMNRPGFDAHRLLVCSF
jgi:hypothetical protein